MTNDVSMKFWGLNGNDVSTFSYAESRLSSFCAGHAPECPLQFQFLPGPSPECLVGGLSAIPPFPSKVLIEYNDCVYALTGVAEL
jgi:hypothetical protein